MQRTPSFVSIKLATVTAALALCGAAYAATGDSASAPVSAPAAAAQASATAAPAQDSKHHHKHCRQHKAMHGHHMRDAALVVPGYGPLRAKFVESLALTDAQVKLVNDAKAEQKEARSARRDAMKAGMKQRMEQLKSGKLNPEAALKQAEKAHDQAREERSKLNEKWLAVWDALDETQQNKIAVHLNERAEKFAKHAQKRAEKHGHRGAQTEPAKIAS